MRYFKVKIGYSADEFVSIDETELEKAVYAFASESKAIFKNGVVRGKDIIGITEDWNKAMGWNPLHKMTTEDFADVNRRIGSDYKGVIAAAKDRVQMYIANGKVDMIGKTPLPALNDESK